MTSRTWPILIFGFGSLVLLIALAGLGASRQAQQIQADQPVEELRSTKSLRGGAAISQTSIRTG